MAKIMTNDKHYYAIAETIREHLDEGRWHYGKKIRPDEMAEAIVSVHESGYDRGWDAGYVLGADEGKAEGIAEGKQIGFEEGYENGHEDGHDEGYQAGKTEGIAEGKKAEYDAFWDVFQNNGSARNYYLAFAYEKFTDANYNPKYPLKCSNGSTPSQQMFYNSVGITDTKVPIYANNNNINGAFQNCSNLKTIRLLSVHATTSYTNAFAWCNELENIIIEGTIGKSISFQDSKKLTHDSFISIITHLSDTVSGQTATFSKTAKEAAFTADEWAALIATKSNWTISLV